MKFGLMYANGGPFAYPEMLTHLATTAERVGVESMWTIEHVVIPVGYKSTYPYDPSGKIPAPEQLPIPDPLICARLRGGGDEDAAPRHRHPHPAAAPSALRRQGGGDARRALARPRDPRHRRRLAGGGVRRARHSVRGARGAHGGNGPRHALAVEGRGRAVRGQVLPLGQARVAIPSRCRSPACRSSSAATPSSRRAARRATATASSPASPRRTSWSGCSASCATSARSSAAIRRRIEVTSGRAAPDVDGVKRLDRARRVALHGPAAGLRSRRRHAGTREARQPDRQTLNRPERTR